MKRHLLIYYNPAEDLDVLWGEFESSADAKLEAERLTNTGTYYENIRVFECTETRLGAK